MHRQRRQEYSLKIITSPFNSISADAGGNKNVKAGNNVNWFLRQVTPV